MRDTVWAIIFSQTPIALGCLWVAWEVRGIRKATERITVAAEALLRRAEKGAPPPDEANTQTQQ